jgi:hypothetical protein
LTLTSSVVARLTAALLWVCAVYFLVRMRSATLQSESQPALGTRKTGD